MHTPADLIADVKLDFSVALDEMMAQARGTTVNTPEDLQRAQDFMHLIKNFYAEQKALLIMIQEAGKILQQRISQYKPSIDDLL